MGAGGPVRMADVSGKVATAREAIAEGWVLLSREAWEGIRDGRMAKGMCPPWPRSRGSSRRRIRRGFFPYATSSSLFCGGGGDASVAGVLRVEATVRTAAPTAWRWRRCARWPRRPSACTTWPSRSTGRSGSRDPSPAEDGGKERGLRRPPEEIPAEAGPPAGTPLPGLPERAEPGRSGPVIQAQEAGGIGRKVETRPDRRGQRLFEGLPRVTPETVSIEAPDEASIRARESREAER